jgi:glycosyltransferase involved in cell wall biosynthesis
MTVSERFPDDAHLSPTSRAGPAADIPLSVCIPTRNRPDLLARALSSVTQAVPADASQVELIVSDNSDDSCSEALCKEVLGSWQGRQTYVRNPDGLGMVGNFNRCVELATGRYVLILHDDDYLMPGAIRNLLEVIDNAAPSERVLQFGVRVVDHRDRVLRRQEFRSARYLPPRMALERALRHSSFVRFPAIVVRRDAYEAAGPFNAEVGGATDFDMWTRLFARFGVSCIPVTTSAYVVHDEAHTSGVWTPQTLDNANAIFARAKEMGLLDEPTFRRCQADWFHQFILGGVVRRLRVKDWAGARRVHKLFRQPSVRSLGWSGRWVVVRVCLAAVTLPTGLTGERGNEVA